MTDATAPKKARAPRKPKAAPTLVQDAEIIDMVAPEVVSSTSKGELTPVITRTTVGSSLTDTFKVDPARVQEAAKSINIKDSNSILLFGNDTQKTIGAVTDQMLAGVRNKDLGPISDEMTSMVVTLRKMDFKSLQSSPKLPGFLRKILGLGTALAKFQAQYDTVESTVAKNEANLQRHRMVLLKDIKMLDVLYDRTDEHLDNLEVLILAGQQVIEEMNTLVIPEAEITAKTTNDMGDAQALRDLIETRDSLERKVSDLMLTRQITIQTLPSIRVVQSNDKNLAEKIQSQIFNTLPLWKQQMVIATSVHNGQQAAQAVKSNREFTNQLIERTAAELRVGNAAARKEIEAGIADIASIEKANASLIGTIQDSLDIAEQGKAARADAEQRLLKAETELKGALTTAVERQKQIQSR